MLKIGIIGLGVGEAHVEGYLKHPKCEIKKLCDFNEEVLNKAKTKYPDYEITKYADDILEDPNIDVVSIASWDNYHFEQIIKGLKNNKHLFIEKPITLFEDEAKKISNLLNQKPKIKISSNLILRKTERFQGLKALIKENKLGDLSYIYAGYNYGRINKITQGWRAKIDFYSIIYGGGVHMIDLMLWLTGDKIIEVSAYGNNIQTKNTDFKNFDLVGALLKFESGLVATLSCNFGCVFPHFHQFEVYGTKATFVNDKDFAKLYKTRDPKNYNKNKILNTENIKDYEGSEIIYSKYKKNHKGDHIYDFIESILNNKEPEVSKQDIFNTMAVCFAIERAAHSNTIEKINYIR